MISIIPYAGGFVIEIEGSAEEAQVAMFLKQLGVKYNKIT